MMILKTILKIYLVLSSIVGTFMIFWFIFGLIYMAIHSHTEKKAMKAQMDEFKEAIKNTGLGKDLNKPLTKDEEELLNKTGHLEFTETMDMETLKVKKDVKN